MKDQLVFETYSLCVSCRRCGVKKKVMSSTVCVLHVVYGEMAVEVLGLRLLLVLLVVWRGHGELLGGANGCAAHVRQRAAHHRRRLKAEMAVHGLLSERVTILANATEHVGPRDQNHLYEIYMQLVNCCVQ